MLSAPTARISTTAAAVILSTRRQHSSASSGMKSPNLRASSSSSALNVSSTVFLTKFSMSLRSDYPSTAMVFAGTARVPFVNNLLFSRQKSHDKAQGVFRYAVVILRNKLCVTS